MPQSRKVPGLSLRALQCQRDNCAAELSMNLEQRKPILSRMLDDKAPHKVADFVKKAKQAEAQMRKLPGYKKSRACAIRSCGRELASLAQKQMKDMSFMCARQRPRRNNQQYQPTVSTNIKDPGPKGREAYKKLLFPTDDSSFRIAPDEEYAAAAQAFYDCTRKPCAASAAAFTDQVAEAVRKLSNANMANIRRAQTSVPAWESHRRCQTNTCGDELVRLEKAKAAALSKTCKALSTLKRDAAYAKRHGTIQPAAYDRLQF